jgi:hypothetical protein
MVFGAKLRVGTEDAYHTTKNYLAAGGNLTTPKTLRRYSSTYCKRAGNYGVAVEAGVGSQSPENYTRPLDVCSWVALKRNLYRDWLVGKRKIKRSVRFLRTLSE